MPNSSAQLSKNLDLRTAELAKDDPVINQRFLEDVHDPTRDPQTEDWSVATASAGSLLPSLPAEMEEKQHALKCDEDIFRL